ncbi:adenylosuccinate synthetase [Antribacter gilvus]|uniref:adenylosuccinate synthetase n=1 Tax=Antribacter gilvus TaxID=2304675 RepID=UPI0013DFA59A|nr:adenylosuccinate synthetase [Antribacter gilvus]
MTVRDLSRPATADVVVGLGFGDEGKGAAVDALVAASGADRVVRFNGGQQAAHNVVVGGRHHTFASFGSGSFSGAPTWVAGYCTVEPTAAAAERAALVRLGLAPVLYVDGGCLVTTAAHVAANHAREAGRGAARHGSTGTGFGETVAFALALPDDAPRAADLARPAEHVAKAVAVAETLVADGVLDPTWASTDRAAAAARSQCEAAAAFTLVDRDRLLDELRTGHTVFEGAQGFWLDESFGFQPHTTWSTTTPANAGELARSAGIERVRTVGCTRTYATRHGAGPLPGEGALPSRPAEPHNGDDTFAGVFRTGAIDADLLRAAVDQTMADVLAVSHADVFDGFVTTGGRLPLDAFGPVALVGRGPAREDRRAWGDLPIDRAGRHRAAPVL